MTRTPSGRCRVSPKSTNTRLHPIAAAIHLALGSIFVAGATLGLAETAYAQAGKNYNIPAGPLGPALTRFAAEAGIVLSFDPALLADRRSGSLQGSFSVQEGFLRLLAGSGYELVAQGNSSYSLRKLPAAAKDGETVLAPVKVTTTPQTRGDGGEKQGYRVSEVRQLGPLGKIDLLDTPFSVNVVPGELIENLQASKPDDIFKIAPIAQLTAPQSRFFSGVTLRGFNVGSTKRIDGLPSTDSYASVDLEDKDRVEIITGLSGFLYGSGNVGGTINYVLKRPIYQRLANVSLGITEGSNLRAHADLGGPIDADGRLAYRLNLVGQEGDTALDHQSIRRGLISGALDWNISDELQLQFDASVSRYRMVGTEPYWSAASGVSYPAALRGDKFWGQPWTFTDTEQQQVGTRLNWRLDDAWALRVGLAQHQSTMDLAVTNNQLTAGTPGSYLVQGSAWEYPDVRSRGAFAFLDGHVRTGSVDHKLTLGWYGDDDERTNFLGSGWSTFVGSGFSTVAPVYIAKPALSSSGVKYTAQRSRYGNLILGDQVTITEQWSALIGINRASIVDKSFNALGAVTASYDDSEITPTLSLIYKPQPWLSLYASQIESLEKGGVAAMTYNGQPVTNAGAVMAPLTSKQIELGGKAEIGGMLLTTALFKIDKGLQYYDLTTPTAPVFVQNGRQVHRGLEFTASGRASRNLTLVAGLTLLDAKVTRNSQSPGLEGKVPINTARELAKIYAEYDVDSVPGLTLTSGLFHTGRQYVDTANSGALPSFTTADVGGRFSTRVAGYGLVVRAAISNLTGKDYWLNSNYIGRPRILSLSAEVKF